MASGNVNKFFDVAYEHNRINNLQLQKKLVKVVLKWRELYYYAR